MHRERMLKFKSCRLARMSNGRYCVIRDLGLVKGGKGMKHHDGVLTLTPSGILAGLFRLAAFVAGAIRRRPSNRHPVDNSPRAAGEPRERAGRCDFLVRNTVRIRRPDRATPIVT